MPSMSDEERQRRQHIAASVIGSNGMEGLTLDGETLALVRRFEEGELSMEELSAGIEQHVQQMLAGRRSQPTAAERVAGAA